MKKYILTFIFCLIAVNAFGATRLYKTVKPSGGDYTSLEACMNANEQNLVTADKYFDVEIDGSWSSADTTACMIHNYTTDATRYINIYTTSAARHNGIYSTSYYRLEVAISADYIISSGVDFVTIDGLQMKPTVTESAVGIYHNGGVIKNCIIRGASNASYSYFGIKVISNTSYIFNNIVYGIGVNGGSGSIRVDGGTGNIYSCTCRNETNTYGIHRNGGTLVAKNCYSGGTGGYDYYGTITQTTCASSDNTSATVALRGILVSTTADATHAGFTNITGGSEDFHIKVGSPLIDVGTDLSAVFTTDIDGTTRPTRANTWDIGADEYVAPAGGAVGQVIMISD